MTAYNERGNSSPSNTSLYSVNICSFVSVFTYLTSFIEIQPKRIQVSPSNMSHDDLWIMSNVRECSTMSSLVIFNLYLPNGFTTLTSYSLMEPVDGCTLKLGLSRLARMSVYMCGFANCTEMISFITVSTYFFSKSWTLVSNTFILNSRPTALT